MLTICSLLRRHRALPLHAEDVRPCIPIHYPYFSIRRIRSPFTPAPIAPSQPLLCTRTQYILFQYLCNLASATETLSCPPSPITSHLVTFSSSSADRFSALRTSTTVHFRYAPLHFARSQHHLQYHKSACMESIPIFPSLSAPPTFAPLFSFFTYRFTPSLHSSFRPHPFLLLFSPFFLPFFFLPPSPLL